MNGDIGIVEKTQLAVFTEGEIILVNGCLRTVWQVHLPVGTIHIDDVNVIAFLIEERIKALCRTKRHIVL